MKRSIKTLGIPLLLLAGSSTVLAHEAGSVLLRIGAAVVDPVEDSTRVSMNGTRLNGTKVGVDSDTQLGLALAWKFADHWGLELLAASPFKHTVTGKGLGIDKVAEVKHLPPTLSLQFYPLSTRSAFQPYFGLGVNYTTFFSEDASHELESAFGRAKVDLKDSWGVAAQVGFDWQFTDHFGLNASVWRVDLETEATIRVPGARLKVDVDLDPWVYMLGVTFRF